MLKCQHSSNFSASYSARTLWLIISEATQRAVWSNHHTEFFGTWDAHSDKYQDNFRRCCNVCLADRQTDAAVSEELDGSIFQLKETSWVLFWRHRLHALHRRCHFFSYGATAQPAPWPLQCSVSKHLYPLHFNIVLVSLCTASIHLPLDLPTGLLPSMCPFSAFLGTLSFFVLNTWLIYWSLLNLIFLVSSHFLV